MHELMMSRTTLARSIAVSILAALSLAAVAYAAPASISYRGQTSQQRPISFTLAGSSISNLRYSIDDRCPDGKLLFVNNWGFKPLRIKRAKFGGKFVAKAPANDTVIVNGRVSGQTVSGKLTDRTLNAKTHRLCSGTATFNLTPRRHCDG